MPYRRCTTLQMMAAVWLLSLVIPLPARAQTREAAAAVPAGPLTLEQVLSLAEPRSEGISIATAAVRRAEADQIRARSGLLPQLSAAASYDRSLASEFDNVFNTGGTGSTCPPFALNPQAALDARVAEIETRTAELDLELETARLWAELNYLIPAEHAQVQP